MMTTLPTPYRPDFSRRSELPELMDDPAAPPEAVRQSLRELEVINTWLGGYAVVLSGLERLRTQGLLQGRVRLVDFGCGGGDTLRQIARWGRKKGVDFELVGVDWNPLMIAYAQEVAGTAYPELRFERASIWEPAIEALAPDITLCSLFAHHFDGPELVRLIARMAGTARRAALINDLHRHWFAFYSIKAITATVSRSPLVRYDAPLSVARSLTRTEWQAALAAAGAPRYELRWMWAWRWRIIIYK